MSLAQGMALGNFGLNAGMAVAGEIRRNEMVSQRGEMVGLARKRDKRAAETSRRESDKWEADQLSRGWANELDSLDEAAAAAKMEEWNDINPTAAWNAGVLFTAKKSRDYALSNEGMRNNALKAQENVRLGQEKIKAYNTAPDEETKRKIFWEWYNGHAFVGKSATDFPKNGKVEITNFQGKKEVVDDLSVEEMDQMIGRYYASPTEDHVNRAKAGWLAEKLGNIPALLGAKHFEHTETGEQYTLVGADPNNPLRDPNGDVVKPFFQNAKGEKIAADMVDMTKLKEKPSQTKSEKEAVARGVRADEAKIGLDKAKTDAYKAGGAGGGSASGQLTQMKVNAWQAYMQGTATPEQQRMIGVDKDQYLTMAWSVLKDSFASMALTDEEKIQKIIEHADLLRQTNQQNAGAGVDPNAGGMGRPTPAMPSRQGANNQGEHRTGPRQDRRPLGSFQMNY